MIKLVYNVNMSMLYSYKTGQLRVCKFNVRACEVIYEVTVQVLTKTFLMLSKNKLVPKPEGQSYEYEE